MKQNSLYKRFTFRLLLALTLSTGVFAFAPVASAANVFDTFQSSFQSLSQSWFGKAQGYANDIFYVLLVADFTWLALTWVLTRKTFDEILPSMIRKVMVYGFFLLLVVNAGTFMPAIINSFQTMGSSISGVPAMTPSTLVDTGDALAYGILTGDYSAVLKYVPGATVPAAPAQSGGSASSGAACNWYTLCLNKAVNVVSDTISSGLQKLEFFLLDLLFAGITWVAFLLIAVDLLITTIEAYVILGVGVVFLGFGASRWTTKFADGILNYAVSVGVKLMMLYLVIGTLLSAVVPTVVSQLMANASGAGSGAINSLLLGGAGVVLMLLLSKSIPSKAQSLLSGAAALGAAHAIQETVGGAAAGAGVSRPVGAAIGTGAAMLAASGKGIAGAASRAFGGSIGGGTSAGPSAGAAAPAPGKAFGEAVGQGIRSAGQAAGQGVSAAGQAAGSAISAIPIPVVAQAAGAAVSVAGQVAGKGIEAAGQVAGKGAEMAGKGVDAAVGAAQKTAQATKAAARTAESVSTGSQATETTSVPAPKSLKPAQTTQASPQSGSSNVFNQLQNAARAAGMVVQHPGGAVQAGHVSTGHGSE